jgi:hypothetical protein
LPQRSRFSLNNMAVRFSARLSGVACRLALGSGSRNVGTDCNCPDNPEKKQ